MEQKLGRYLLPSEVVHHIDGNPQNNAPDNLLHFATNAAHLKHELTGRVPNWTPEGWAAMQVGIRKPRNRRSSAPGDDPPPQPIGRQPSLSDSIHANPASGTSQTPEP
jgi:hypothetical protein